MQYENKILRSCTVMDDDDDDDDDCIEGAVGTCYILISVGVINSSYYSVISHPM